MLLLKHCLTVRWAISTERPFPRHIDIAFGWEFSGLR